MKMKVTCVGVLVVDFTAANLQKISDSGEVTFTPIEMNIGGHSANVSIDLLRLGLRSGEVSSIGAVGDDLLGNYVEDTLNSNGVITHLITTEKAATSKDLILVVKGEDRRFHTDVGANVYLDPAFVEDFLESERPIIFYVGAVGVLGNFDERLSEVLRKAKDIGCTTFIDPVRPYGKGWDFLTRAVPSIDIFHCNNLEALEMTGRREVKDAVEELISSGVKLAIISMGEKGLMAGYEGSIYFIPAFKVDTIDPTGAGDAFCAGFVKKLLELKGDSLAEGFELEESQLMEALIYGEASGAICVTDVGTTTAINGYDIEELIEEQRESVVSGVKRIV